MKGEKIIPLGDMIGYREIKSIGKKVIWIFGDPRMNETNSGKYLLRNICDLNIICFMHIHGK